MVDFILAIETHRNQSLGTIIRCAVAFGARYLMVVGSKAISTHGAHGSQRHIRVIHCYDWESCLRYVNTLGSYEICGISPSVEFHNEEYSGKQVESINSKTFTKSTLFMLGNSTGLTSYQVSVCDSIVHIPVIQEKYNRCIHYEAKLSICLWRFTQQFPSVYMETCYTGEKYDVDTTRERGGIDIQTYMDESRDVSRNAMNDQQDEILSILFQNEQ